MKNFLLIMFCLATGMANAESSIPDRMVFAIKYKDIIDCYGGIQFFIEEGLSPQQRLLLATLLHDRAEELQRDRSSHDHYYVLLSMIPIGILLRYFWSYDRTATTLGMLLFAQGAILARLYINRLFYIDMQIQCIDELLALIKNPA